MIRMMEGLAGVNYLDIPLDDKKVLSLFTSPRETLGLTQEQLGCTTGTLGIPGGTAFVRGFWTRPSPPALLT